MKITELPKATAVNDTDIVPIVQDGETKQVPKKTFVGIVPDGLKLEDNTLHITKDGTPVGKGVELPKEPIDTELSDTSENTVQNKVVTENFNTILGGTVALDISSPQKGYYTGNVGEKITEKTSGGSKYAFDLSKYFGSVINVKFSTESTGGRITALCNADDIIVVKHSESEMQDTGWDFNISNENYKLYVSFDTARTSNLSITVKVKGNIKKIEEQIFETNSKIAEINKNFKVIQPHNFPTLPYAIIKKNNAYELLEPLAKIKKIDEMKQYYVNSVNGLDTNDGLTADTPFKTLKKAFTSYLNSGKEACINIINDNAVFFESDLYGQVPVRKNLAVRTVGNTRAKLISGLGNVSWENFDENVSVTTITENSILGCVDISESNIAKDEIFEPMTVCTSLENCQATENSYFIDGQNVYVHKKSTSNLINIIPLIDSYKVRWSHETASGSNFLYLENLNIIGASYNAARIAAYPQTGMVFEYLAENCIYQHNMKGDCVPHNGYDVVYEFNCKAGFSKADLFNTHHAAGLPDEITDNCIMAFINCTGREAGYYSPTATGNNNIFTAHDGENVIRLNCSGYNADGPLFADVNGCRSVNIDCASYNTTYPGVAGRGSWVFNNVNAKKNGFVTLQNCNVYDNRNNPKIYSECDIEINGTDIFTDCEISGKITLFSTL